MKRSYAVDASSILNPTATGVGHYTRSLVAALDHVCAQAATPADIVMLYRSGLWRERSRLPKGTRLHRQIWHKALYPRSPAYAAVLCPEFRMPSWPAVPRVGVIHDIHPVLGFNTPDEAQRQRIIADLNRYVAQAQRLIFVSHHARGEFSDHFAFPAERMTVIHHGVGDQFRPHSEAELSAMRMRHGVKGSYCLWSGTPRPSKNVRRLLQGFARCAPANGCELLLAGHVPDEARKELDRWIADCGLQGRARILGYVPEADVAPLFAGADAYLFPSLHEGFGMPILEAMASGTPVLTSTTTACPEAAGGHAILVDPESVDDIARGIGEVLSMAPERIQAAWAYAKTQTWERSAQLTLEVLAAAASEAGDAPRG